MPSQLKNLNVNYISLVKAGANRKFLVWKSAATAPDQNWETTIQFRKLDEEKRLVYGVVYEPDAVDTQGDFAAADDIEKAAHNFLKQNRIQNIDTNHNFQQIDAVVVESWIVKTAEDPLLNAKQGAWCVAIHVEDDAAWEAVKKGEFQGISMAGTAEKITKATEGIHISSYGPDNADITLRINEKNFMEKLKTFLESLIPSILQKQKQKSNPEPTTPPEDDMIPAETTAQLTTIVADAMKPILEKMEGFTARVDTLEKSVAERQTQSAQTANAQSSTAADPLIEIF